MIIDCRIDEECLLRIVSILKTKVRIYTRYRYIYTDLYRLMLTYLTYADRMLEIVKILVEVSDDNSSRSLPTRLISVAALLRLLSHVPALAHSN